MNVGDVYVCMNCGAYMQFFPDGKLHMVRCICGNPPAMLEAVKARIKARLEQLEGWQFE